LAGLERDFWSVEMAVPWGPLKATPVAGKVVGPNANRDRLPGDKTWATWARLNNSFHDPNRFAHLVLSGTPEMIGKLSAEFRRGDRTGPLAVYSAGSFAQSSGAHLTATALADVAQLLADLGDPRRQEKSPEAAAEIGQRLDEYRATSGGLRQQGEGRARCRPWTRLDLALQGLVARLRKAVEEARPTALLSRI
jgi:hypothetical protein